MRRLNKVFSSLSINTIHNNIDNKMKKNNNIEFRSCTEVRLGDLPESRTVHGLAIPVESPSSSMRAYKGDSIVSFVEVVRRSAITPDLITSQDVKLYADHLQERGTLARSKFGHGSMKLSVTERGLEFECDLPKTAFGDEILEGLRRGDYGEVSFGFITNQDSWEKQDDGTYKRYINGYNLLDEISILSQRQAFPDTGVALRSLEASGIYEEVEETRAAEEKEKITSTDDDMPLPKSKDYNKRSEEETKPEETKPEETEEKSAEEETTQEEEAKPEDNKPEDKEETAARDAESEEENKPEEEEQKSEQEDEEDNEEEDRMLAKYYTSLRALIK